MKSVGSFVLVLIAATVVVVWATGLGAGLGRIVGVYQEETRREIMETSKAFRDGTIRQMRDYQARYAEAKTPEAKGALKALVMQELNSFPESELPADLATFVAELRASN